MSRDFTPHVIRQEGPFFLDAKVVVDDGVRMGWNLQR